MRKITLVLLFCFCAVGFSQAQTRAESSDNAATNQQMNFVAPKAAAEESRIIDTGDITSFYLENNRFAPSLLEGTPENQVSTHLINHNANSVELVDGATAVSGQVTISTGVYNGRSYNNPSSNSLLPVLAYESGPYF